MEPVLYLAGFAICVFITLQINRKSRVSTLLKRITRNAMASLSILLLAALLFTPAEATTITEYLIPGNPVLWDLSVNTDGTAVYFTESMGNNIGYLLPGNATVRQIPVPTPGSNPCGITFVPWFSASAVFTENYGNRIGVLTSNSSGVPRIVEYEVPTAGAGPGKIVYDQFRNVTWFTEQSTGKLGNFTCGGLSSGWRGTFGELLLPGSGINSNPIGIAVGTSLTAPAVNKPYLWVADFLRRSIVRIYPEKGSCREYVMDPFSPWDLVVDPDGTVWFTAQLGTTDVNVIGRLDPVAYETNKWSVTFFSIPTPNCVVRDIEIDQYGNLWFTEENAGKIGKYSPVKNTFTEYTILTPNAKPKGLVILQSSGVTNVWFTELRGIGRVRQPEGPTVSTTVSTLTYAVTTSSTATTSNWTSRDRTTFTRGTYSISLATVTGKTATTTSSTVADTVSMVLTSPTYSSTTYTYTTSTSFTTTTSTYTTTSTSVELTPTTTTVTGTTVSTTWQSFTLLTTVTYQSISWFSETRSTTVTTTQESTVLSPTVTVPTTITTGGLTTVYSPTVTWTSTTYTGTTTITTSTVQTTITTYSPTVTATSTSTTMTTVMPLGAIRPCVIASAAYGSELAGPVQFLREFRNDEVLSTFAGSQFMKAFNMFYYSFSPTVASMIVQSPALATVVRAAIYPLVGSLEASSHLFRMLTFSPELGMIVAGIFGSALLGIVYLTPAAIVIRSAFRHIRAKRCRHRANSDMVGSNTR